VLGGMIDNHVREKHNKVPLLGDIPILGHLFRYDTETNDKRHLLIFIRPTILTKAHAHDCQSCHLTLIFYYSPPLPLF
jgi:general secretion pathway protein D